MVWWETANGSLINSQYVTTIWHLADSANPGTWQVKASVDTGSGPTDYTLDLEFDSEDAARRAARQLCAGVNPTTIGIA